MVRVCFLFFLLAGSAGGVSGTGGTSGPVAHWTFDVDFTAALGGPDFDGAPVNGAIIDTGHSRFGGGSARFDKAEGQYVLVDESPFSEGSFTFAAWYYLDVDSIAGRGDAHRYFVLETGPAWTASFGLRYDDEPDGGASNGSVVSVLTHDNGGKEFMPHVSSPSPAHREWRHVVVTYDADRLLLTAYIDGVFIGSARLRPSASRVSPTEWLAIGGHRDGGRNWKGWIDDVAVWDRVLTAGEIEFLQENPVSAWETLEREVFAVYMAPDGDDGNSGLEPGSPVLTIGRAHAIVRDADPQMDVEVRIASGTYRGQQVTWRRTHPEFRTTFTAFPHDGERPVFDGCLDDNDCPGGTWFTSRIFDGAFSGTEPTNLEFLRLTFQNYRSAISIEGDRHKPDTGFSARNRVEDCRFYRIGSIAGPNVSRSTAAIRFINSKENVIRNNDFEMIVNVDPSDYSALHALYFAHYVRDNAIVQNRFIDNSGDAVRLRDSSHGNVVLDNVFIRAGRYGYSDWYCDFDNRDDCTKLYPECPSWGGRFHENILESRWEGEGVFAGERVTYQPDESADCPRLADERVSASRNVYAAPSSNFLEQHRQFSRFERAASGGAREPIVFYDLWHNPTAWQPTSGATEVAEGLIAAPLSRGPGINASNLLRGFSANGWNRANPSRETALANGDYYEFAVTVKPGYTASITALEHRLRRSGINAAMYIEWQYSFDGFAVQRVPIPTLGSVWQTLGRPTAVFTYLGRASGSGCVPDGFNYMQMDVCDQNDGNMIPRFELSTLSPLQEIPGGTTVTFRMYGWGNTETAASNSLAFGREVGPLLMGTVTRDDSGPDYTDWRERHFPGEAGDDRISGPQADPAAHGVTNLVSYYLGLDPWSIDRERLPVADVREILVDGTEDRYLTLSFRRLENVPGAEHRVFASGDPGNGWLEQATLHTFETHDDGTVTEVWRDAEPVSENSRRFLIVEIEEQPAL